MKKFLIKISYTVFPIWFLFVGLVCYLALYVDPNATGDIGRLALIPFGHQYNHLIEKEMPKDTFFQTINKTEDLKSIHVDVLTIGDSFSQQNKGGFQNYLSQKGVSIVNCWRKLYSNPIQYAYNVLDKGLVDSSNIKVLIVESVERGLLGCVNSFSCKIDETEKKISIQGTPNANKWSLMRARDYIYYKMGKKNIPIYNAILDGDYFSSDDSSRLYFYHDDVDYSANISTDEESKVINVVEALQNKANENGVLVILMIAVDKYDLYQNHIINNSYPHKTINEDLERILGEKSPLLLTKKCLAPMVEKGEKDVFLFNDTHWSYKASEEVAKELFSRIQWAL